MRDFAAMFWVALFIIWVFNPEALGEFLGKVNYWMDYHYEYIKVNGGTK